MANGRMINHAITKDLRINQLSDDTSRLAFTWLVTFADRDGRTYGDPAIVRSMLFPRRDDISISRMTDYIQEWYDLGLIIWYQAEGDKFIFFPSFEKNQRGMRPERESPSIIPQPPADTPQVPYDDSVPTPELVRSNDGVTPEESRIKRKEVKLKEEKGTPPLSNSFDIVQRWCEEIIRLPMSGQADITAIAEMVRFEMTRSDLEGGYNWLVGHNRTIRGAASILEAAKTEQAKRIQEANKNGRKPGANEAVWIEDANL